MYIGIHARSGAVLGFVFGFGSLSQALSIVREDIANGQFMAHADCQGPRPGGTDLIPIGENAVKPGDMPGLVDTLRWQYSGPTRPGVAPPANRPADQRWDFQIGGALKGKLFIEVYIAGDTDLGGKCIHGANFLCRYEKHADDPDVDFVQMVEVSRPFKGLPAGQKHIDPYPDTGADDSPYYYRAGEARNRIIPNPPGSTVFQDLPEMSFDEGANHSGYQKFWLVLASKSGRTMTLHEGIHWGWTGGCAAVPEPATMAGLALGGILILRRRR
ncbi:MAG TPA: PEP-CTERM sorting domain-containing protein [Fimbriimonadaceae bacterium]|nr:PEP-CTERM sorting domain-containing protein [Fimbriimonadaceae bacterium]